VSVGYVESSALVKLAINEPEAPSLRQAIRSHDQLATSELAFLEVGRAARRDDGDDGLARTRAVMLPFVPVTIDRRILEAAVGIDPTTLRSLDAIHVATALGLQMPDLVFYSYDQRTISAAEANGLTVASPGA